jgi:hypothetical protein
VPGCSVFGTGFLLVGCSSGTATAAAKGTAFGTDADADIDSVAGADVPEGDST